MSSQPSYTQPQTTTTATDRATDRVQANAQSAQAKASSAAQTASARAAEVAQQVRAHPAVQQAQDTASHYVGQLDKELSKYPVLNEVEARTSVPKAYLVIGGGVLLTILINFNYLAQPTSNFIGWALPSYLSFKALESSTPTDDVQWLTYWIIFGFFNYLESFALRVVLYYVPWYFALKTIFVIWLQLPATKGARRVYQSIFQPAFRNYQGSDVQKRNPFDPKYPGVQSTTTTTSSGYNANPTRAANDLSNDFRANFGQEDLRTSTVEDLKHRVQPNY